ncbi:hypothetical protein KRZ98_05035, partial [Sphingobium sp. AS12]|uniref:hypothetical protein n=1 Tax=Sphingobium sp. AS12 TaxID=2849495 RepID=UPI001C314B1C
VTISLSSGRFLLHKVKQLREELQTNHRVDFEAPQCTVKSQCCIIKYTKRFTTGEGLEVYH